MRIFLLGSGPDPGLAFLSLAIYLGLASVKNAVQGGPKKLEHLVAYYVTRCSHFFGATL